MALTEQEVIEAENFWCEYCCNFDKEHIGMDGMALCKITNTLAYSEESGKDCPFFNKPKSRYIELPCAVGDTVYWVTKLCDENGREESAIHEGTIISFSLQNDGLWFYCRYKYGLTFWHKIAYFGKTVFLTKEEAEKALENKQ